MSRSARPLAERSISLFLNDFLKADAWAVSLYDSTGRALSEVFGHNTPAVRQRMERMRDAWRRRKEISGENVRSQDTLTVGRERAGRQSKAFLDALTPIDAATVCLLTAVWDDESRVEVANEVGPKVRDALRDLYALQRRAEEAERLGSAMRKTLDCLNAACVISDKDGKIAYANSASDALLDTLGRARGCPGHEPGQSLRELIAAIGPGPSKTNGADGSDCLSVLTLQTDPDASTPAYVMRLETALSDRSQCEADDLFGIFVPKGEGLPDAETLAKGLRLSRSESRVAALIIRGKSIQQAATQLGLSEQTARTYLKRIFGKVGISRQTQLGAAAAMMYLPVGNATHQAEEKIREPRSAIAPPRIARHMRNSSKPLEITGSSA